MKELVAVENFTGRPFVIQFGCQFTGDVPDHGNFGSVIVEQPSQYGGNKAVLSFLLNKVCFKNLQVSCRNFSFSIIQYYFLQQHLKVAW